MTNPLGRPTVGTALFTPPPINTVEDTGLSALWLQDLALKIIYCQGYMRGMCCSSGSQNFSHVLEVETGFLPSSFKPHSYDPIYGWETTPWQASIGRPALATPVKGLLLAGHWTRPIQGVMSVILSGSEAARMILRAT